MSRAKTIMLSGPVAVLLGVVGVAAGGASASASTLSKPNAVVCSPNPGTILTSKATSSTEAWIPTNLSSSYLGGPGTIARTYSATSTVSGDVSASFSLNESLLFASADETYGASIGKSVAHTETWTYTLNVAAGHTDKAQQFHEADELGIKQTYMGSPQQLCAAQTETSTTGNFFPDLSTADDAYCFVLVATNNPAPEVGKCVPKP